MSSSEEKVIDAFQKETTLLVELISDEAKKGDKADKKGIFALFSDLIFMREEWTERARNPTPIAAGSFATGYRPSVSPEYITRLASIRARIADQAVKQVETILKARKLI